ncbi:MAG: STM3941 family protein [Fimbriimonadales bacterium]
MSRTVVQPRGSGLAMIAVVSGVVALLWLILAAGAALVGGLTGWIIVPVSLMAAMGFSWVCGWSLNRRAKKEPAIIIDEVGIFDNVSVAKVGRLKWGEIAGVRVAGPKSMRFLCILPNEAREYIRHQTDGRRALMWLNNEVAGAPVIIPMAAVEMSSNEVMELIASQSSEQTPWTDTPEASG